LVMSLAKPQRAKREVIKIKGKSTFLSTTGIFFIIGLWYLGITGNRAKKRIQMINYTIISF
jgi:hypothetical protein